MRIGKLSVVPPEPDSDYRGHAHFWERAFSRRQFMGATLGAAGAVAGSGLLSPVLANGNGAVPKPIGYGFQIAPGTPVFRFPNLDDKSELGVITDFRGLVGAADVMGTGTGTNPNGTQEKLNFDSDMRFMKGTYVGMDEHVHKGTFAFI
jgi:hypothetical protein